jgi:hypothetical protein
LLTHDLVLKNLQRVVSYAARFGHGAHDVLAGQGFVEVMQSSN